MIEKVFTNKELQDMANEESLYLKIVDEKIIDQRRWATVFEVIFQDTRDNRFFKSHFDRASTECQECTPYDYDKDEINCKEVVEKEILVKQWVIKD